MSDQRILVVEDNRDNLTLILDLLHSLNYETLIALDGEEALKIVRDEKPALILLDLSMPKLDGWETARIIRQTPELQQIPIIALTAHALLGDREKAIAAGCNDYVSKPINFRELHTKVVQLLAANP